MQIVTTKLSEAGLNYSYNNEEDNHMVAHFIDALKRRVKHALVVMVDSDMVEVLKKSFLFTFQALWVETLIQRRI